MKNKEKSTFQIPNYNQPEQPRAVLHTTPTSRKNPQQIEKPENPTIFNDLLNKSHEIAAAREEAKDFLRKRGINV